MPDKQLEHQEVMLRKSALKLPAEIILVLDQLIFQENIAGILRVANSMSVYKVWLLAENKLIQSKSFRSISRLNPDQIELSSFSELKNLKQVIQDEISNGFTPVALEYTNNSISLDKWQPPKKTILIAGSERHGVCTELLEMCEQAVHIPMLGNISSINVNQAVSIALWDIRRREL